MKPVTNTAFNVYPECSSLYCVMVIDDLGKNDFIASFMEEKHAKLFAESLERDIKDPSISIIVTHKNDIVIDEIIPQVRVEEDLCIGCGLCSSSSNVFNLSPDGHAEVVGKVTKENEAIINNIVSNCPVQAIVRD